MSDAPATTVGIEEEYLTVDADSLDLRPMGPRVLAAARPALGDDVAPELTQAQIEIRTEPCATLDELRDELVRLRRATVEAAASEGTRVLPSGTHPFADRQQPITRGERYHRIERRYQHLAREQLVCGCHVHVQVLDPEAAIRVMDRSRPWLAVLLALATNSPFWRGHDTGFASFRREVFDRWPLSGPPQPFGHRAAYDRVVDDLVATEAVPDATYLYWDVRPSTRYPTVEFRVADVCQSVDETVTIAALTRSVVRTALRGIAAGEPLDDPRHELVEVAEWRACRYGLDGGLIDLRACRSRPAAEVVRSLLAHLRDDLEEAGEWATVSELVDGVLARGSGARRQREALERSGSLQGVVAAACDVIEAEVVAETPGAA